MTFRATLCPPRITPCIYRARTSRAGVLRGADRSGHDDLGAAPAGRARRLMRGPMPLGRVWQSLCSRWPPVWWRFFRRRPSAVVITDGRSRARTAARPVTCIYYAAAAGRGSDARPEGGVPAVPPAAGNNNPRHEPAAAVDAPYRRLRGCLEHSSSTHSGSPAFRWRGAPRGAPSRAQADRLASSQRQLCRSPVAAPWAWLGTIGDLVPTWAALSAEVGIDRTRSIVAWAARKTGRAASGRDPEREPVGMTLAGPLHPSNSAETRDGPILALRSPSPGLPAPRPMGGFLPLLTCLMRQCGTSIPDCSRFPVGVQRHADPRHTAGAGPCPEPRPPSSGDGTCSPPEIAGPCRGAPA